MTRTLALAAALLLSGTAQAARACLPPPPLSDETLNSALELGQEIEARADGDLNGDGDIDTAFVVASPDARTVHVVFAARRVDAGHVPTGSFKLAPDPLRPAALTIDKGVLVIKDISGGTTALAATYRFRGDKTAPRLRLIGLDAAVYSRIFAHDGSEMSWSLLTGDIVTSRLKVASSDRYDKLYTQRFKRPHPAIFMEDTPDPELELVAATNAK